MTRDYQQFIKDKVCLDKNRGFDCSHDEVNPILKPHQKDIVVWAVRGGYRAIFTAFGLGKTVIQLEVVRLVLQKLGGASRRGLIVMPLGIRQEFLRDAAMLGTKTRFVRTNAEAAEPGIIYLTNYESVREGKIDPKLFDCVSLDEAAILRGFGGTKTFREFMKHFEGSGVHRFVATATPSPNEFIELLAYAAFLDVMDVSQAKTRFFKRDSTKADKLTLHAHKEEEFWLWVASWAIFVQKPSDLGHSDEGYKLPPLTVTWHEIESDHSTAGTDRDGQGLLFRNAAMGVQDASREKRDSLNSRVKRVMEIVHSIPESEQVVIWCDLNDEQKAIESALNKAEIATSSLYGSQDLDVREALLLDWKERRTRVFLSKPIMYGAGVNLQQCSRMIFAGIGFKFADVIQSVHRIHRFLQRNPCEVHMIYTEAEREIRAQLERKWSQHVELTQNMTAIIQRYGLCDASMASVLQRKMGVERREASGRMFRIVNNDCVDETGRMDENSVGLILTSIPFSTQYEYSPNYCDFGHTESNEHFFEQMDYLTPNLLRILQPGRLALIHVKDRIVPGGMTNLGFQTVYPFHAHCIEHFTRHGFAYMGMKTIVTDVVRENNQTYRLGWTEQCKDGTKMGVGMPEYLLIFRKPPTDNSNSYADTPVVKRKEEYSRSRWQVDAHGFTRSNGNRLLMPEDLEGLPHEKIFKLFRQYSLENIYDFEHHVKLGEALETCPACHHIHVDGKVCGNRGCECSKQGGRLPVTFMLLQPQSWHPDVWTDITRMRTLNCSQWSKGKEMHLCPMQFDLADRAIIQWSMPGEIVFDPFAGLGTVPLRALKHGRFGLGCELNTSYWYDALSYLKAAEAELETPDLFDLL